MSNVKRFWVSKDKIWTEILFLISANLDLTSSDFFVTVNKVSSGLIPSVLVLLPVAIISQSTISMLQIVPYSRQADPLKRSCIHELSVNCFSAHFISMFPAFRGYRFEKGWTLLISCLWDLEA